MLESLLTFQKSYKDLLKLRYTEFPKIFLGLNIEFYDKNQEQTFSVCLGLVSIIYSNLCLSKTKMT